MQPYLSKYPVTRIHVLYLVKTVCNFRQYQIRVSYELLAGLANSLLNDTIFEIVKGLMEIQHVTEKHLMQVREKVENDHQRIYYFLLIKQHIKFV